MSNGLRQKERCRRAGSGRGSEGLALVKDGVCYSPACEAPRLLQRRVLRGRTPRVGPGPGQRVCKLDPGRAGDL